MFGKNSLLRYISIILSDVNISLLLRKFKKVLAGNFSIHHLKIISLKIKIYQTTLKRQSRKIDQKCRLPAHLRYFIQFLILFCANLFSFSNKIELEFQYGSSVRYSGRRTASEEILLYKRMTEDLAAENERLKLEMSMMNKLQQLEVKGTKEKKEVSAASSPPAPVIGRGRGSVRQSAKVSGFLCKSVVSLIFSFFRMDKLQGPSDFQKTVE